MGSFSLFHWIILAVLLLLLFGGNRFSTMMKDVAKGMRSFKEGLSEDDEKKALPSQQQPPAQTPTQQQVQQQPPIDLTARPADQVTPPPAPPASDEPNR